MIVLGADTHKRSHTIAAVAATTGELMARTAAAGHSLFYGNWGPRVARRLARTEQTMRVRIARDELRRIRELSHTIKALEAETSRLVDHEP
jgi:hypothetical protein